MLYFGGFRARRSDWPPRFPRNLFFSFAGLFWRFRSIPKLNGIALNRQNDEDDDNDPRQRSCESPHSAVAKRPPPSCVTRDPCPLGAPRPRAYAPTLTGRLRPDLPLFPTLTTGNRRKFQH